MGIKWGAYYQINTSASLYQATKVPITNLKLSISFYQWTVKILKNQKIYTTLLWFASNNQTRYAKPLIYSNEHNKWENNPIPENHSTSCLQRERIA